ncbi:hypothetical protein SUDANB178_03721 [Streptomyces sp. enrichment culture]
MEARRGPRRRTDGLRRRGRPARRGTRTRRRPNAAGRIPRGADGEPGTLSHPSDGARTAFRHPSDRPTTTSTSVRSAGCGPASRFLPVIPCSITCLVTAFLHRFGDFLPSTDWGLRSCPELRPQGGLLQGIHPAHGPVESWTNDLHRLWITTSSPGRASRFPPVPHRLGAVVPSEPGLLHMAVHCSATRRPRSPRRVKGVTGSCRIGLWETWVFLGTQLGRTALSLWAVCAELSVLHRGPRLSTGSTHRGGG